MYKTAIFTVLVLALHSTSGQNERNSSTQQSIYDVFQEKCRKYGPTLSSFDELQKSAEHFGACVKDNLAALVHGKSQCTTMKTEIYGCAEAFFRKLRLCLRHDEVYLYDYGLTSVKKGLEYICKGTHFSALFNEEGMTCLRSGHADIVDNCYKNSELGKQTIGNEVILPKERFCKDVKEIMECFNNYAKLTCSHIEHFASTLRSFLAEVRYPCRFPNSRRASGASVINANFTLIGLLAAIIISKIYYEHSK